MPTSRVTNIKASPQGQAPRAKAARPTSKNAVLEPGRAKKRGGATNLAAQKKVAAKKTAAVTNANPALKARAVGGQPASRAAEAATPKLKNSKAKPAKTLGPKTAPKSVATRAGTNSARAASSNMQPTKMRPAKASTENVSTAKTAPTKKPTVKTATERELRHRRFRFALGVTALVVCGTAGFTAVVFPGFAKAEPPSAPVTAVQIAAPLLARTAQERIGEQTALVAALPDQVGIWVQSGINGYMGWLNDEVVEAWNITYLDGVTAGDGEDEQPIAVRLTVGQWPTPLGSEASKARLFYESQTKGLGGVVMKGNVKVGDTTTGQYVIVVDRPDGAEPPSAGEPLGNIDPASIPGDAQGVMWWRNGTVVIKAVGPISVLPDFFSAFPL